MRYENLGPVTDPNGSASDVTKAMLAGTGRDPEAFARASFAGQSNRTCPECGRVFDLMNATDADEWHHGHDCEV